MEIIIYIFIIQIINESILKKLKIINAKLLEIRTQL